MINGSFATLFFMDENSSFVNFNYDLPRESLPIREAFPKHAQYIIITLYSLATFLSVCGNVTVIIVLTFGRRTSIRSYLINLAISDIIMATFSIPFSYTNFMYNRWIFLPAFCRFAMFFQHVSVTTSVYTLVTIGIDRYKALMFPLNERWTKQRVPLVIGSIWLFSFLVSSVQLIVSYAEKYAWNEQEYFKCLEHWPSVLHEEVYTVFVFILTFGLPVISLGYTYISIVSMMWSYRAPGDAQPNRDQLRMQAKIKVINMMIAVMLCFILCWFPLHILLLIVYFVPRTVNCRGQHGCFVYYVSFFVCHWVAMANSFMNPLIYCFMSKNFKNDLLSLVSKCSRKRERGGVTSEARTRSEVGSSFRSILYVTQKTSLRSSTRGTGLQHRLVPARLVDETYELETLSDKPVRRHLPEAKLNLDQIEISSKRTFDTVI